MKLLSQFLLSGLLAESEACYHQFHGFFRYKTVPCVLTKAQLVDFLAHLFCLLIFLFFIPCFQVKHVFIVKHEWSWSKHVQQCQKSTFFFYHVRPCCDNVWQSKLWPSYVDETLSVPNSGKFSISIWQWNVFKHYLTKISLNNMILSYSSGIRYSCCSKFCQNSKLKHEGVSCALLATEI